MVKLGRKEKGGGEEGREGYGRRERGRERRRERDVDREREEMECMFMHSFQPPFCLNY